MLASPFTPFTWHEYTRMWVLKVGTFSYLVHPCHPEMLSRDWYIIGAQLMSVVWLNQWMSSWWNSQYWLPEDASCLANGRNQWINLYYLCRYVILLCFVNAKKKKRSLNECVHTWKCMYFWTLIMVALMGHSPALTTPIVRVKANQEMWTQSSHISWNLWATRGQNKEF